MLALRRKINAKTWQPLSRNVAVNDKIVKNGMSLLNLDDNDSVRITKIENKEIVWRRAHHNRSVNLQYQLRPTK